MRIELWMEAPTPRRSIYTNIPLVTFGHENTARALETYFQDIFPHIVFILF